MIPWCSSASLFPSPPCYAVRTWSYLTHGCCRYKSTLAIALHHTVVHPQLPLSPSLRNFMPLSYPGVPQLAPTEPEHAIEQSDVELCVISGKGELRCRDPPLVIRQGRENRVIFVSFVAVPKEVGP